MGREKNWRVKCSISWPARFSCFHAFMLMFSPPLLPHFSLAPPCQRSHACLCKCGARASIRVVQRPGPAWKGSSVFPQHQWGIPQHGVMHIVVRSARSVVRAVQISYPWLFFSGVWHVTYLHSWSLKWVRVVMEMRIDSDIETKRVQHQEQRQQSIAFSHNFHCILYACPGCVEWTCDVHFWLYVGGWEQSKTLVEMLASEWGT